MECGAGNVGRTKTKCRPRCYSRPPSLKNVKKKTRDSVRRVLIWGDVAQ